jgi:hypothetical protein
MNETSENLHPMPVMPIFHEPRQAAFDDEDDEWDHAWDDDDDEDVMPQRFPFRPNGAGPR